MVFEYRISLIDYRKNTSIDLIVGKLGYLQLGKIKLKRLKIKKNFNKTIWPTSLSPAAGTVELLYVLHR